MIVSWRLINLDRLLGKGFSVKSFSDKELLDWLDANARGYGNGWICRDSTTERGLRVHETVGDDAKPTVREAIADAIRRGV